MATKLQPGEEKYAAAIRRLLADEQLQKQLEADPIATLEGLGLELDEDTRKAITAPSRPELEADVALWVSPLVRVVTGGTRPVVSVVTGTSTVSATREAHREAAKAAASPKGSRRRPPKPTPSKT